ncbi:hypothetical protein AEAC466_02395 [Asticcacaulis sp. AC466]|uniref:TetR/AcrR family transcriptional regulator n=1 Tax=Asticcacaulis sp. AC466 TaxID=1282362 RepID=UPI0003C3E144|nr:TetR/AcrR family transcriptional regulator [Asticcacaulis sp. AC466]ESQ86057.1 hypothetical protein AEAC466_02395 [Asticcacaulis sp. AC466]
MVQNNSKPIAQAPRQKARGRPKAYDRTTALKSMRDLFWEQGYAGTSLDDMSAVTAMNRPSLYNAFGDKASAFKAVLEDYVDDVRQMYMAAFAPDVPVRDGLTRVYETAIHIYNREDGVGRGCFMISAALIDSVRDRDIAAKVLEALHEIDRAFRWRLKVAQQAGELSPDADIDTLGMVASTTHNAVAVRMRAGEDLAVVRRFVAQTVGLICG